MEKFHIYHTDKTPEVMVDFISNHITIKGVSSPENSIVFFEPIIAAITKLIKSNKPIIFNFDLEYFNSSSSKKILDILLLLKDSTNPNEHLIIWHYEEDDFELLESGEIYQEITKLAFNYKAIKP